MTDEQIIRAVAEHVMGWSERDTVQGVGWIDATGICRGAAWTVDSSVAWNPLTNDDHACAVLDKMAADGWAYSVLNPIYAHGASVSFQRAATEQYSPPYDEPKYYHALNTSLGNVGPSRRRCVCAAALKAVGAWQEGGEP